MDFIYIIYKIILFLSKCLTTILANIWLDKYCWTICNQMILGQNIVKLNKTILRLKLIFKKTFLIIRMLFNV